jgi:hypothetical protein
MDRAGLSQSEANQFMFDWAGQGAATSPRTKTPTNLRNASFLLYERGKGTPLTPERQKAEQAAGLWGVDKKGKPNLNRPGFPMMEMHTQMADELAAGTFDPWHHPKPGTFRENWRGNMADVTGDTHNIRKVLDAYDRLNPGGLPREWFTSPEAYETYVGNKGFPKQGQLPVGDIKDTLEGQMIPGTGRYAQTEYPVLQGPTNEAARLLNISPAEAQERLWFEGGPRTNLQSPPVAIPGLLNSQIEATARATGLSPEAILRVWARRKIPLAEADVSDVPGYSTVG